MKRLFAAQVVIVAMLGTACLDELDDFVTFVDLEGTPAGDSGAAKSSIEKADEFLDDAVKTADWDLLEKAQAERPGDPEYVAYDYAFAVLHGLHSLSPTGGAFARLKAAVLGENPSLAEPGLTELANKHAMRALWTTNQNLDENYHPDLGNPFSNFDRFRLERFGCAIAQGHTERFGQSEVINSYASRC